jgi:hypothetical protein
MTETNPLDWPGRLDRLGWPIQSKEGLAGFSIPCFVSNLDFHLTTVNAFADGSIGIWGTVDRGIFRRKFSERWVWMAPSADTHLHIHGLGSLTLRLPEWRFSNDAILDLVDTAIGRENPNMTDLVDLAGEETEPIPGAHAKARRYKLPLRGQNPVRMTADGACLMAAAFPVVMTGRPLKRITKWFVFADGMTRFGPDGPLIHLDEATEKFSMGEITTHAEDGDRLDISGLGVVTVDSGSWGIDPDERVREARNELDILNGGEGAIRRCVEAFKSYTADPSDQRLQIVRMAYAAVPVHLRIYCGNMDQRDLPIRRVLGLS